MFLMKSQEGRTITLIGVTDMNILRSDDPSTTAGRRRKRAPLVERVSPVDTTSGCSPRIEYSLKTFRRAAPPAAGLGPNGGGAATRRGLGLDVSHVTVTTWTGRGRSIAGRA